MKVTPLDLRQQKFRTVVRGFDRAEVEAFLSETAEDYEQALRDADRLRDELTRAQASLEEHRESERNPATRCSRRSGWLTKSRPMPKTKPSASSATPSRGPTCCSRKCSRGSRIFSGRSTACA